MSERQSAFGTGRRDPPAMLPASGDLFSGIVDFVCVSQKRVVAYLVLMSLVFFLPGFFTISPIDRDEARFAQASKQMVETGDFVDIRFQDQVRYKKPVGIYWLQAATVAFAERLGVENATTKIWLYRLPSLFGAIGAVLLTYWTALAFVRRRGAVLAALLMGSSILLGVEARLAKTDAVLLFSVLAAQGALARVYLAARRNPDDPVPHWKWPAIFWTALAGGVLVKGPLILLICGLTIVTLVLLDRSARWLGRLRPLWGMMWLLVLVLPWFVAIVLKSGDSFFAQSVGGDLLGKVASGQESHGAPPGYYLLLVWVTFWPGATLAALAAPAVFRARREAGAQFLLAWLVPAWLLFEIVPTKLPHYVLPLYPALAILAIGALEQNSLSRAAWLVRGTAAWFVLPVIVALASIIGTVTIAHSLALVAWPFAALAMIFGLAAWWLYDGRNVEGSLLNAVVASMFVSIAVFGIVIPKLKPAFPSARLAEVTRDAGCEGATEVASAGYQEPSLVFLHGTRTLLTDASGAADFLRAGGICRFAFVDSRLERAFGQRAEAIGLHYDAVTRLDAFDVTHGREISIAVFRPRAVY